MDAVNRQIGAVLEVSESNLVGKCESAVDSSFSRALRCDSDYPCPHVKYVGRMKLCGQYIPQENDNDGHI